MVFSLAVTTCSCKMQLNLRETKKCFEERYRCYGVPKIKLALCLLWTSISKFEFSFTAPIHSVYISQTNSEENLLKYQANNSCLYDCLLNSRDHFVLWGIVIERRNLMLINVRAYRINRQNVCYKINSVDFHWKLLITV